MPFNSELPDFISSLNPFRKGRLKKAKDSHKNSHQVPIHEQSLELTFDFDCPTKTGLHFHPTLQPQTCFIFPPQFVAPELVQLSVVRCSLHVLGKENSDLEYYANFTLIMNMSTAVKTFPNNPMSVIQGAGIPG